MIDAGTQPKVSCCRDTFSAAAYLNDNVNPRPQPKISLLNGEKGLGSNIHKMLQIPPTSLKAIMINGNLYGFLARLKSTLLFNQ